MIKYIKSIIVKVCYTQDTKMNEKMILSYGKIIKFYDDNFLDSGNAWYNEGRIINFTEFDDEIFVTIDCSTIGKSRLLNIDLYTLIHNIIKLKDFIQHKESLYAFKYDISKCTYFAIEDDYDVNKDEIITIQSKDNFPIYLRNGYRIIDIMEEEDNNQIVVHFDKSTRYRSNFFQKRYNIDYSDIQNITSIYYIS